MSLSEAAKFTVAYLRKVADREKDKTEHIEVVVRPCDLREILDAAESGEVDPGLAIGDAVESRGVGVNEGRWIRSGVIAGIIRTQDGEFYVCGESWEDFGDCSWYKRDRLRKASLCVS
jgi:hypothetical protein